MLGSHPLLDHRLNQRNLIGSQISHQAVSMSVRTKAAMVVVWALCPLRPERVDLFRSSFQVVPQDGKHLRGSSLLADSPSTARLTTSYATYTVRPPP
jgi:hypothetical protein